jgi:hypothetical protein
MDGVPARFLMACCLHICTVQYSTARRGRRLARSLEPDLARIAQQVGLSPAHGVTHHTAILTAQYEYSIVPSPVERRRRRHRPMVFVWCCSDQIPSFL